MTNTSPSLLLPNDAKQAARNTPPPLPPPQPGEAQQKSARIHASKMRDDNNDDGFKQPYPCRAAQTSLEQNLAAHTAPKAPDTAPPHVVAILGKQVTPTRPTKPPEPEGLATLLKGNFFGALASNNDETGSKTSKPNWESDIDDIETPPELGNDPHLKAIVKMLKDHGRKAKMKISSLRQYLRDKMERHSVETMDAFAWERGQRENALLLLREKNEKEIANREADCPDVD
jgi:hypothetical protein